MITLRKLASLKEGTRQRKYVRLFRTFEEEIRRGGEKAVDELYLKGLMGLVAEDISLGTVLREKAGLYSLNLWLERAPEGDELLRSCNNLRHLLLAELNMEPGDWDLMAPEGDEERADRLSFPVYLYLEDIRSPFNVGAIFRTAEAMGVREIFLSPGCASPSHPRSRRSAMGAVDMLPWRVLPLDELVMDCFALELGGEEASDFDFPREGRDCCAIIGSEELGVSPEGLARAEESLGRVSLAMRGRKGSLNVSVATGILLYQWTGCLV
ncbi:MAG: TrmH family RNA methyltransferase [Spirochaetales bacterium]|nr:TrmH family RNA methyltransferase [Spirochaetales bacterium]